MEIRNELLCALGKIGYFQKILWAQFLHLLLSRKALKSLMVISAPHGQRKSLAKRVLDFTYPFSLKSYVILTSLPASLGAVSQNYLNCCLLSNSPHFCPKSPAKAVIDQANCPVLIYQSNRYVNLSCSFCLFSSSTLPLASWDHLLN